MMNQAKQETSHNIIFRAEMLYITEPLDVLDRIALGHEFRDQIEFAYPNRNSILEGTEAVTASDIYVKTTIVRTTIVSAGWYADKTQWSMLPSFNSKTFRLMKIFKIHVLKKHPNMKIFIYLDKSVVDLEGWYDS